VLLLLLLLLLLVLVLVLVVAAPSWPCLLLPHAQRSPRRE